MSSLRQCWLLSNISLQVSAAKQSCSLFLSHVKSEMNACAWRGGQVLGSKDSFRAEDPGATALNIKAALILAPRG